MERLTKAQYNGNGYYMACSEECHSPADCIDCAALDKLVDRLAAYEDTGLTPDVCAEYKKFEDEAVGKGVTFKRIVELMNAEAEGRLVVLPCKVGDTLYITEPRFYNYKKHEGIQHGVCRGYELDDRWGWITKVELDEGEPHTLYFYNFSAFGKTVFLSHEEAEAALKGGAE